MSHITNIVYALKKEYGTLLTVVSILTSEVNTSTGSRTITKKNVELDAIYLPSHVARKFVQDIGYLAANKNFTYGGLDDYNNKIFVLSELCDDDVKLITNLNGYIIHKGDRFNKVKIENYSDDVYILTVKSREGDVPYNIINLTLTTELQFNSLASGELNV